MIKWVIKDKRSIKSVESL